mmetsp:Transcript_42055/g.82725  ORF Transcript_42055/g.82725 Transcript_42055/m.82725 type:complete len:86 (+) Transcript_42055:827-1084(+)
MCQLVVCVCVCCRCTFRLRRETRVNEKKRYPTFLLLILDYAMLACSRFCFASSLRTVCVCACKGTDEASAVTSKTSPPIANPSTM